jgi:SAM-dependent methyltransferase
LRPGAKVLDIGASEGCILHAIAGLEASTQRVAVEPNPTFGAFAVQHAGCELHPSVEALRQSGAGGFDLVVINHVYEHVKHPVQFLAGLRDLLAPGARVYIDVPDVTAYRRLEDLHIAHLYHFGPDTLDRAARLAGYEVLLLERHAPLMHPLSLRCLLTPAAAAQEAPPLRNLREGWAAVARANRRAGHFHRKRWSWLKRLQHRLGLRKPAAV